MTETVGHAAASRRVLVVGLGNPDRGDDGIGAIVARRLMGRLPSHVAIMVRSGDILSLIEDWGSFDALICADATAPMGAPGRIHRIDLETGALPNNISPTSSHSLGIADAIALARALNRAPQDIIVYAIEGCCFSGGAPVTPQVATAAGEVADRIIADVIRLRRSSAEAASHV
jgi:hydrogenase maturation protease